MSRFFAQAVKDGVALLSKEDTQHVVRVLRFKEGDRVEVVADGLLYHGKIVEAGKKQAAVKLLDAQEIDVEPRCKVTLYQSLPKAAKMEFIIQKCVEIGVARIVPVLANRCVAKPNDQKAERWQKIAREACKQCGRIHVPPVGACIRLDEIPVKTHELFVFAYEKEADNGIKAVLTRYPAVRNIGMVIGPEGGFEQEEAYLLTQMGAQSVSLGKRIFRSETAGMAALSAILYHYGDLDG